jgi:hypothetical protein
LEQFVEYEKRNNELYKRVKSFRELQRKYDERKQQRERFQMISEIEKDENFFEQWSLVRASS